MNVKMIHPRVIKRLLLLLIVPAFIVLLYYFIQVPHSMNQREYLNRLSTEKYEAIFCTMFSTENFTESDFLDYCGFRTVMSDSPAKNVKDIVSCINQAVSSGNYVHHIYLGLDPEVLRASSLHSNRLMHANLKKNLLPVIEAHPEITFEVLFTTPSMEYWMSKKEEDITTALDAYSITASALAQYGNVTLYYPGAEDWLIRNPLNYDQSTEESGTLVTPDTAKHLLMLTFCDGKYRLGRDIITHYFEEVNVKLLAEKVCPTVYQDQSDLCIVFLGDSIIGNFSGPLSVPGATNALSGATTYNLAVGGTPAVLDGNEYSLSFLCVLDYLTSENADSLPPEHFFRKKLEDFWDEDISDKKLYFVVNYGLNDYFSGRRVLNPTDPLDTSTYAGALRVGLTHLKQDYPEAEIILATPNFVSLFENGTQTMSEVGGVLTDYAEAALEVSQEMDVWCLDNYHDLGVNSETADLYLADMCHLDDNGRFLYAEKLLRFIEEHQ